jgi:hypothetical protein
MRIEQPVSGTEPFRPDQNLIFSPCFEALSLPEPASISLETLWGG